MGGNGLAGGLIGDLTGDLTGGRDGLGMCMWDGVDCSTSAGQGKVMHMAIRCGHVESTDGASEQGNQGLGIAHDCGKIGWAPTSQQQRLSEARGQE